ncbi:TBC1 domain family member 25, partial [Zootermopsis nevadensis]
IKLSFQKCEGVLQPEYRKFSVDPQITSFEVLQSILAKAFDIRGDFTVCYRAFDDYGQETYLSLLSDWDLDAAFLSASEPCLCLQVDMKPFEESSDDWDLLGYVDVPQTQVPGSKPQNRLPGLILNQVERTFNMVQRALNLIEEQQPPISDQPPRTPLTDAEFRKFLDPIGQVVQARELRTAIYYGGIEPSLRKVVWKHILNVYPDGMSGKERMDYMKKKAYEYQALRDCWKEMVQNGHVMGDVAYVTSMVRKDVLRTDRHHRFYAGSDDNQNIASLFNILTTYALNHPTVSYCQGMSDLASPLLVTMGDEAHAYICFCALMKRLHSNFMLDGIVMTLKFQHLSEGILYYDPEFYAYLKSHQADDLLFCYRWLLLEMKREFAFDDALRMLEVLWSSLPPTPPQKELQLFEKQFCSLTPGDAPLLKTPRENAYTKVCALRRQSSAASISSLVSTRQVIRHRQNQSLDETSTVEKQNKVMPFSSLDDTSIRMMAQRQESKSQSTSLFETLSEPESDETSLNHINRRKTAEVRSGSTDNLVIPKLATKRGYLQNLKQKLSGSQNKNLFPSVDKSNTQDMITDDVTEKTQVRVVKNLNEFLNFTALNKNRLLPDKIVPSSPPKKESTQVWQENTSVNKYNVKTNLGDGDLPTVVSQKELQNHSTILTCDNKGKGQFGNKDTFCDGSSPDDSAEYFPMTTSMTRELRLELENLDRQVFGSKFTTPDEQADLEYDDSQCVTVSGGEIFENEGQGIKSVTPIRLVRSGVGVQTSNGTSLPTDDASDSSDGWVDHKVDAHGPSKTVSSRGSVSSEKQNCDPGHLRQKANQEMSGIAPTSAMTNSCEEVTEHTLRNSTPAVLSTKQPLQYSKNLLPPPSEFGGGNPFLMFLCLTVLRQHRDIVMGNGMDYNEMAMHFDKMIRKHNVTRVLNQARQMFATYLRQQAS